MKAYFEFYSRDAALTALAFFKSRKDVKAICFTTVKPKTIFPYRLEFECDDTDCLRHALGVYFKRLLRMNSSINTSREFGFV